jgi:NAD(P)-dependent dehydrogenase (short-subunit alcohol dehydrogenase family)
LALGPDATTPQIPLAELLSLEGRVAVVTGAGRGIGAACCARLYEAGATVAVADLDQASAGSVAARLGQRARAFHVDVAVADSVCALASATAADLGGIDVWVNAAGVFPATPLLRLEVPEWDHVIDVNLRGSFLGAREAARIMVATGRGGIIINISSTAAYAVAGSGVAHYVSSKFGVRGLTKSLAAELGPHGIRVLAVAPTVTLTPGLEASRAALGAQGFLLEELAETLPLGRVALPDDVARAVVFCAGGLSSLMTGSTLLVDAGELTR